MTALDITGMAILLAIFAFAAGVFYGEKWQLERLAEQGKYERRGARR